MKEACIIGRGRWARRLKRWFERRGAAVTLLDSRAETIDVAPYTEVIIAYRRIAPKRCWNGLTGGGKKIVTSCVKGLLADGRTIRHHLQDNFFRNFG